MANYRNQAVERLFRSILLLQSPEECSAFFEDLCTITELQEMSQRLEAAMLLRQGMNYQTISKTLGISTTTISRVSRCINYGSGGYETVLSRLEGEESDR